MIIITATGRLGRDAELRSLNSGEKLLSFSVGADTGYGQNKKTVWLDASIFGQRGERLAEYLKKGTRVTLVGEMGQRTYQGKDGKEVTATTVKVMELDFSGGAYEAPAEKNTRKDANKAAYQHDLDDEIPF